MPTTHWTCDDADPWQMLDARGLAPLSVTGSAPLVAGKRGTAREFRQAGGVGTPAAAYAIAPAPEALCATFRAGFTVALWLQWYSGGTTGGVVLDVHSGTADTPITSEAQNRAFQLGVSSRRPYVAWRYGPSSTLVTRWFAYILPENEWAHLAVRLDGGTLTLFVNGAPAETFASVPFATGGTDAMEVNVGAQRFSTGWRNQVNAGVDEFRLYARALTNAEVATIAMAADARSVRHVGRGAASAAVEEARLLGVANRGAASAAVEGLRHPRLTNRGADSWRNDG